jgi:hypothetical protein
MKVESKNPHLILCNRVLVKTRVFGAGGAPHITGEVSTDLSLLAALGLLYDAKEKEKARAPYIRGAGLWDLIFSLT